MQSLLTLPWGRVVLKALLLIFATLAASAASPKWVLVLTPYGREVAPVTTVISSFGSTLSRALGEAVDIYELPPELERFEEPDGGSSLASFLEGRIKEHSFVIVVPVATAGMQFAAMHRDRLFPNTPILVLAAEPRMVSPELLKTNATLVIRRLLKLPEAPQKFVLTYSPVRGAENELAVNSRSMLQIMQAFAGHIDVPEAHLTDNSAWPSLEKPDSPESRQQSVHIRSGKQKPASAFAAVRYRDYWFWVDRDFLFHPNRNRHARKPATGHNPAQ